MGDSLNAGSRQIEIIFKNKSYYLTATNNYLLQSTISCNFLNAGRLIWIQDGKPMLLNVQQKNNDYFILLEPDINRYEFEEVIDNEPKKSIQQSKLFENMIESIKSKRSTDAKFKKLSGQKKVMNKVQEVAESESNSLPDDPYQKRVIFVSWKHRSDIKCDYLSLGSQIAPKKRIEMNGRKDYTLEEVEKQFKDQYVTDMNREYFDNSIFVIANNKLEVIAEFVNREGEACSFWTYCKVNRGQSTHALQMYILTTKLCTNKMIISSLNQKLHSSKRSVSQASNKHELSPNYKSENKPETLASDDLKINASVLKDMYVNNQSSISATNRDDNNMNYLESKSNTDRNKTDSCDEFLKRYPPFPNENSPQVVKSDCTKNSEVYMSVTSTQNTGNKRSLLPHEGKFAVPLGLPKKSKVDIIKTLKLSVPSIQSGHVQMSEKILGRGGQGVVRLGLYLGCKVAIKTMSNNTSDLSFLREVQLLSDLRHDNIISIRGVSSTDNESYIVMEYFKSRCLHVLIFRYDKREFELTEYAKDAIAYQISCAINYLHNRQTPVIHQDIKPGNILVNRNIKVKLCDFGLGKTDWSTQCLQSTANNDTRGTHVYMSPETLTKGEKATKSSDIWSFAATILELYTEKTVWPMKDFKSSSLCAQSNILMCKKPDLGSLPFGLKNILAKCFEYDPLKRPSIEEIQIVINDRPGCSNLGHLTCD